MVISAHVWGSPMWLFLVRASNSNECVKGLSDASLRSCDVTENRICIYYSRGAGAIKVLSAKEINDKRKLLYPHYKEAKRQNKKAVLNVDRLFIDGTEFKLPDDRMENGNGNHGRGHGSHTITIPPRLRNNRSNGAWQGVRDRGGGGAAQ